MKHTSWGINVRDMDTKIRPQDDFYAYSSGGWLARSTIPKNESRWGSFMKLRKDTDSILHSILSELAKKRGTLSEQDKQLRDFFRSGMDMRTRNARGIAPLLPWQKHIDAIRNAQDLSKVIGTFERFGIGGPWGLSIDQDFNKSTRYIVHLYQSGLGMPDRDYYLKGDTESKRVRDAYVAFLERMQQPVDTIMRIETELAKASMTKEELREPTKLNNPYRGTSLKQLAPGVDWSTYFSKIGTKLPSDLNVMQPEFVKVVNQLFTSVNIDEWKAYLYWHLLLSGSSYLTAKIEREAFTFYGTTLAGVKEMKPLWRRVLGAVNGHLGEMFGRIYVKRYFTRASRRKMNELIENLFAAYEIRIQKLDWMSVATKKKALAKLRKIRHKIGHPTRWKSYRGLIIKPDDYAGNALRSAEYEHKRQLKKLGRPIDRNEWLMYPQTVNAYYQPPMNEIVFPAAILQPPFFSPNFDDAVNYGSIGSVIGHEISHAFDDEGSQYDRNGNLKSWWTADDRARFIKKTKVLVEQFGNYTVADGIKVNGQLTLGENIADLGGVAIAYQAYQRHLKKNKRIDIGGFTPEQRFFLGFSVFERELTRPEFEKTHALIDPHSPGKFRINGPASNLFEFYQAFGVKKSDKLYREPKDRAKIW